MNNFDPDVWGPHYWFFLHTIAESYPEHPNETIKRKYYDLIQNMPIFIPVIEIGNKFSNLLDKYPITPYLCSRESFVRWVHFIHNKINVLLNKKEISLPDALQKYRSNYKSKKVHLVEKINNKKHYIYAFLIILLILFIYQYYE
jgi:hypothetical protein|tara:strand:- start:5597 stop:6028 length:432 start_codon:yes stop_codon:yes gene_type:complete